MARTHVASTEPSWVCSKALRAPRCKWDTAAPAPLPVDWKIFNYICIICSRKSDINRPDVCTLFLADPGAACSTRSQTRFPKWIYGIFSSINPTQLNEERLQRHDVVLAPPFCFFCLWHWPAGGVASDPRGSEVSEAGGVRACLKDELSHAEALTFGQSRTKQVCGCRNLWRSRGRTDRPSFSFSCCFCLLCSISQHN